MSDSKIVTISICGELAGVDYGKCPSKKETYFGYKVHVMKGYITIFGITPAFTDDREDLRDIVEGQSGLVIFGGKVYVRETLTEEMADQGICLMALK